MRIALAALLGCALLASGAAAAVPDVAPALVAVAADETGVPRAECGAGSQPETGVQGQVPRADRDSGRSQQGYACNMTLIGQYQGDGATWLSPAYRDCVYLGSFAPGPLLQQRSGVQVVDASDQREPRLATSLDSTAALLGTWETLKVEPGRGLLAMAGASVPPGVGGLSLDIYDIEDDCTRPRLLNGLLGSLTIPMPVFAHEGQWSPDGRTYYLMSAGLGAVQAIDVADPTKPRLIYSGTAGATNHGVSFSPDGRTMYGVTMVPPGVQILDVSDIQDRKGGSPLVRQIGAVTWTDGLLSQHTINFTRGGHPYLYAVDEAGGGGVRLVDIADPTRPRVARQYRLEINRPENRALAEADTGGDGAFGYDAHYCSIDRQVDPTLLACGYFQSGLRLFDIRDPLSPREVAYYNPPAQVGRQAGTPNALVNSAHAWAVYLPNVLDPQYLGLGTVTGSLSPTMNTDWCSSAPVFRPDDTIWMVCQDNGFLALRYQLPDAAPPADGTGPKTPAVQEPKGAQGSKGAGKGKKKDAKKSGKKAGTAAQADQHAAHDASAGAIPETGSRVEPITVLLGLALLAAGVALLVRSRRADE